MQVIRRAGGIDIAVFTLHGLVVFVMHQQGMKDKRAKRQAELLGNAFGTGFFLRQMHHGVVAVAARGDFLLQVVDG